MSNLSLDLQARLDQALVSTTAAEEMTSLIDVAINRLVPGIDTGTSGGVIYFDSTTTIASSGLLASHGVVLGGGAGAAPHSLAVDSSTVKVLVSGGSSANPAWGTVAESALAAANQSSLNASRYAMFTYSFGVSGGAQGNILLSAGPTLPSGAIIQRVFLDIITQPTSLGSATVALKLAGDADILTATAIASLTAGLYEGTQDGAVANMIKLAAAKQLTVQVATADLASGKFYVVVQYVLSSAT